MLEQGEHEACSGISQISLVIFFNHQNFEKLLSIFYYDDKFFCQTWSNCRWSRFCQHLIIGSWWSRVDCQQLTNNIRPSSSVPSTLDSPDLSTLDLQWVKSQLWTVKNWPLIVDYQHLDCQHWTINSWPSISRLPTSCTSTRMSEFFSTLRKLNNWHWLVFFIIMVNFFFKHKPTIDGLDFSTLDHQKLMVKSEPSTVDQQ